MSVLKIFVSQTCIRSKNDTASICCHLCRVGIITYFFQVLLHVPVTWYWFKSGVYKCFFFTKHQLSNKIIYTITKNAKVLKKSTWYFYSIAKLCFEADQWCLIHQPLSPVRCTWWYIWSRTQPQLFIRLNCIDWKYISCNA